MRLDLEQYMRDNWSCEVELVRELCRRSSLLAYTSRPLDYKSCTGVCASLYQR